MNVIEVDNVSFSYRRDDEVVKNITFAVPEQSVTMLIGPNGSGKTTLLKMLVGLLEPRKGSIRVLGKSPKEARREVGYVPQQLSFDTSFPITVFEFLHFAHSRVSVDDITALLAEFKIGHLDNALLGGLSGGQLQRVLIVNALLDNPEVLFFDEPVSGVDVEGEKSFYDLIKDIQQRHKVAIVMVSHDVHIVHSIASQVICINKEMLCSGVPDKALIPEVVEQLYGKDAALYKHH